MDEAAWPYRGVAVRLSLPSQRLIALSCTPNVGGLAADCGDDEVVVPARADADEEIASPSTPTATATRESARSVPPRADEMVMLEPPVVVIAAAIAADFECVELD
jgi:hypothetical protein